MSRAGRSRRGSGDPTVADPDLLAGRLFFGVPIPGPARAPLEAALPRLEPLLPGARLAPPGGWHLTLAFLGQVQPEMADEVVRVGEAAVAGVGPARLRLEGAGTFPDGPAGPGPVGRHRRRRRGPGRPGRRPVRRRRGGRAALGGPAACPAPDPGPLLHPGAGPPEALDLVAAAAAESEPWEARELACFRSTLGGPRGARYRVVREFPLTGRA